MIANLDPLNNEFSKVLYDLNRRIQNLERTNQPVWGEYVRVSETGTVINITNDCFGTLQFDNIDYDPTKQLSAGLKIRIADSSGGFVYALIKDVYQDFVLNTFYIDIIAESSPPLITTSFNYIEYANLPNPQDFKRSIRVGDGAPISSTSGVLGSFSMSSNISFLEIVGNVAMVTLQFSVVLSGASSLQFVFEFDIPTPSNSQVSVLCYETPNRLICLAEIFYDSSTPRARVRISKLDGTNFATGSHTFNIKTFYDINAY